MVMQPGPVCDAYEDSCRRLNRRPRVIYMTPQGRFNQKIGGGAVWREELVFLCGHYEGIDERALEAIGAEYLSLGDFVLTGGSFRNGDDRLHFPTGARGAGNEILQK